MNPRDADMLTVEEQEVLAEHGSQAAAWGYRMGRQDRRRLSLRARLALTACGTFALATAVGYLLPLVIRPTVEAVSAAFVLGILAAVAGAELLERLGRG